MRVVVIVSCIGYAALALLTMVGSRRRGDDGVLVALSCIAFPAAWIAWYVQDELRSRQRRSTH